MGSSGHASGRVASGETAGHGRSRGGLIGCGVRGAGESGDHPCGWSGALALGGKSWAPRAVRQQVDSIGPARGGPRLSSGWDTERRRSLVRWWTHAPSTARARALAAVTGRPAVPLVRGLPSRCGLTFGVVAPWLWRGTRGCAGGRAGAGCEARATGCACRLASVLCACRWCLWCAAATWRVELDGAAVGCTVARATGAVSIAPATTIENTSVGFTTRSIDGPWRRCIRNA
jgi:hypothetical protein